MLSAKDCGLDVAARCLTEVRRFDHLAQAGELRSRALDRWLWPEARKPRQDHALARAGAASQDEHALITDFHHSRSLDSSQALPVNRSTFSTRRCGRSNIIAAPSCAFDTHASVAACLKAPGVSLSGFISSSGDRSRADLAHARVVSVVQGGKPFMPSSPARSRCRCCHGRKAKPAKLAPTKAADPTPPSRRSHRKARAHFGLHLSRLSDAPLRPARPTGPCSRFR